MDNANMRGTQHPSSKKSIVTISRALYILAFIVASQNTGNVGVDAKLADRSRVVERRYNVGKSSERHRDNGKPIGGQAYRRYKMKSIHEENKNKIIGERKRKKVDKPAFYAPPVNLQSGGIHSDNDMSNAANRDLYTDSEEPQSRRRLGQLSGCCYDYYDYGADDMCGMYGQNCDEGGEGGGGSGDEDCSLDGLSFIGISFSVNTANGNPYSYQLCDQFPMEHIIDRSYDYVMSMDEDGWLVGGGYKAFDYSGKMPYIDSSHTELVRIGSMDTSRGGTSIAQVYDAMESLSFPPFSIFPEYVKGGGGHHSGDNDEDETPSGDVTLVVSIVDTYDDDSDESTYSQFLDALFDALDAYGGGPCMDDKDTDPHVSMSRGVKFHSAYAMQQYSYSANLEVAVWQAMYPNGVPIGSKGSAAFPPGRGGRRVKVGYGSLYFFFDRANITKSFQPNRYLTDDEKYYATLYMGSDTSGYYESVQDVDFNYGGSHDQNDGNWEHNPYGWKASMSEHDFTDGWSLPPNCYMEGETFFGIPLSQKSDSTLQSTTTFQTQFDFSSLIDHNYTYVTSFGTNHGWLIGESLDNGVGSIVDKDTAHIPIFYTGTTNNNMGGMSLSDMIKIGKNLDFGPLYIKPAFVFIDGYGHLKMQFEADSSSSMGYLYDALCKQIGIQWNGVTPSNNYGVYGSCAMHSAGDRAQYGCGPDNSGEGGFCPQMTLAYSVRFASGDHAAAYLQEANNYVDYWRSLYPSGVAVGWKGFCPDGGCLGLFLNRYDLFNVFKPDLGGSWVEYNGASFAPTFSPAPTYKGGCDEPRNFHLDKCFRKHAPRPRASIVVWDSLGVVGQFSVLLVSFMATTLSISIFLARARKRKRNNEGYIAFFFRDLNRKKKRKKRLRRRNRHAADLGETMLDGRSHGRSKSKSRSGSRRSRSRSRHRRSRSRGGGGGASRRSRSAAKSYGDNASNRTPMRGNMSSAGSPPVAEIAPPQVAQAPTPQEEPQSTRHQLV